MDWTYGFNELDFNSCNIALILFIGTTVDKLLSGNLNLNIISTSIFIIAMLSIRFVAN